MSRKTTIYLLLLTLFSGSVCGFLYGTHQSDQVIEQDYQVCEIEPVEPEWRDTARMILMDSNARLSLWMADLYVDYIEAGIRDFRHIAEVDPLVVARIIAKESNARFQGKGYYPGHTVYGPMQVSDIHVRNLKNAGIIKSVRDLYGPPGITAGIFILASYRKSRGDDYIRAYSGGASYAEGFE